MGFTKEIKPFALYTLNVDSKEYNGLEMKKKHIDIRYYNILFKQYRVNDFICYKFGDNECYVKIKKMVLANSLAKIEKQYKLTQIYPKAKKDETIEQLFEMYNNKYLKTEIFIYFKFKYVTLHNINLPKFYTNNNINVREFLLNGAKTVEIYVNKPKYDNFNKDDILNINPDRLSIKGGSINIIFALISVKRFKNIIEYNKRHTIDNIIPKIYDSDARKTISEEFIKTFKDYQIIEFKFNRIQKK